MAYKVKIYLDPAKTLKCRTVPAMASGLLWRRAIRELGEGSGSAVRCFLLPRRCFASSSASPTSSPSLSIWRRKKEMGKEGIFVVHQLKRLASAGPRLDRFMKSNVARLLRTDLLAVLAELQRQDHVFLSMKVRHILVNHFLVR